MVKVGGPLHSEDARGTLGGVLTFQGYQGGVRVERKPLHKDRRSVSQLSRRARFLAAVAYWNRLTEAEKTEYRDRAVDLPMTGYNLCLMEWLLQEVSMVEAHKTQHEDGGTDEIDVTGLLGLLGTAQTPEPHADEHEPGGGDPMAVDAAAGTGSLRTLGTGAAQAAGGTHGHAQLHASVTVAGDPALSLSGQELTLAGVRRVFVGWVTKDAPTLVLGNLPAEFTPLAISGYVKEAFNSDGTDYITVGTDADHDLWGTEWDVSGGLIKTSTLGVNIPVSGAVTVNAYYVAGGSAPTTGKVLVRFEWTANPAAP